MLDNMDSASSWSEFWELDRAAYHALKQFTAPLPNGPWSLIWAFSVDNSPRIYAVTLKSMRTGAEQSFSVKQSGSGFSIS